ncbi:MAG: winged helix DNA-binding protein [Nocardioides sp.]|nr:winged helix DNA-binding protein [Nocardioides sp.]
MSAQRTDFGVALAIAHVTFQDDLVRHMAAEGFEGFTARQGAVLRLLGEAPMSLRGLATRLQMTSPGALKLVATMTAAGLVERVAEPADRRLRLVRVTDRGHDAVSVARRFHAAFERDLAERLGADVVRGARTVLEDVAARAPAAVPASLRGDDRP